MFMAPGKLKMLWTKVSSLFRPMHSSFSRRCYFLRGISSTVTLAFGKV
jgi:hypothetical protein